jgi:hypothetical protein
VRVLVTGAREWKNEQKIRNAFRDHTRVLDTLIHGGAKGADQMADRVWRELCGDIWDIQIEVHRPDWDLHGRKAGFVRNQYMVDLGVDLVLAFALAWESGTGHCARYARRRQVPVVDYGVDTSAEARP